MMRVLALLALAGIAKASNLSDNDDKPLFKATRISFDELANGTDANGDPFWTALREVGLLSITNVPNWNKNELIKDLQECLHSNEDAEMIVPDVGTGGNHRRRTLATHSLAGVPNDLMVATQSYNLCPPLQASSEKFRAAVQNVSDAIARRFGSTLSKVSSADGNLLPIQTVMKEGEHLEHFHSYYPSSDSKSTTTSSTTTTTNNNYYSKTIDWHTDQGMMLLFTPGQDVDGTVLGKFFIRLRDGSDVEVDFDSQIDDLVIMLGDGVHQYLSNDSHELRAVPHTLSGLDDQRPRLWYGRMLLPPPTAFHPASTNKEDPPMTFGDLRASMIRGDTDALQLGCASSSMMARELMEDMDAHSEETKCDEDTSMFCWMKCMNYTDYDVSPSACQEQGEELQCANEAGGLWAHGIHSSEYSLRCLAPSASMEMDMEDSSSPWFTPWRVSGIIFVGALVGAMF